LGDCPIALMLLMLLRKYFLDNEIRVVGKVEHGLDMAKKLGADTVFKFNEQTNNDDDKEDYIFYFNGF
jgi:threonine dehydrogenase-like Zn-dependent dehydrogenase